MQRRNTTLIRMVTNAMLIALYTVLSVYATVKIPNVVEISWASLPVLLAAFLFGLPDAVAVAACGAFIEQMLTFGLAPTTPLWVGTVVIQALVAGALAAVTRRSTGHNRQVFAVVTIVVSEFVLTFANTGALYLDAHIMGYPVKALWILLPARLVNGCARSVLSAFLVPGLLTPLSRAVRGSRPIRAQMTEDEAIAYIHSHHWQNSKPGLSRIAELLEKLHNPQDVLRFVHVAGTNGKGSVSAMLESALRACGYRTGMFTSPYITHFRERIQLCGVPISAEELARLTTEVRDAAREMAEPPTEFELITAIGFLYFKRQNCNIVVMEVGLGGRLDPTNIIKAPLLSVITGVALDHTALLGETVAEIAAEKAGIAKTGMPLLYGGYDPEARAVIERITDEVGAPFFTSTESEPVNVRCTCDGTTLDYGEWRNASIPLVGLYQVQNLVTALAALTLLRQAGLEIPRKIALAGLAEVHHPARFERLSTTPEVFFDGAHNPEGIAAAVRTVRELLGGRVLLVCGMMQDKAYAEMVKLLSNVAVEVFAVTPGNPRALFAEALAAEFVANGVIATAYDTPQAGAAAVIARAAETGLPVLACGSLYLYGDVAPVLCGASDQVKK